MAWLDAILMHFKLHPTHLFILLIVMAWGKSTIIISSFLPPATVILLAGMIVSQNTLHFVLVWLAVTIGAFTGSVFNYHVGHIVGNTSWIMYMIARYTNIMLSMQNQLKKNSMIVLFSTRFLAVLRYIAPLVAGILRINVIKVYLISLFSAATWAALYVGVFNSVSEKIARSMLIILSR